MKLRITIEGKVYDVDVEVLQEPEEPAPPAAFDAYPAGSITFPSVPGATSSAPATATFDSTDPKIVRSPLAGLVITVNVEAGQTVEANQLLMVLEAMKMETQITAQQEGTIKSIQVAPGDSVKLNQILVEFE